MIVYYHETKSQPPKWLEGARDLITRPLYNSKGYFHGIGAHYLLGRNIDDKVEDLEDGWSSWINGDIFPVKLLKDIKGQPVVPIEDSSDRIWYAPIILGPKGDRAFQVKYGPTCLPALTAVQEEMITLAKETRVFLPRIMDGVRTASEEDMKIACTWCAKFLSYTNHIHIDCFFKHCLLDDALVIGTLMAVSSFSLVEDET